MTRRRALTPAEQTRRIVRQVHEREYPPFSGRLGPARGDEAQWTAKTRAAMAGKRRAAAARQRTESRLNPGGTASRRFRAGRRPSSFSPPAGAPPHHRRMSDGIDRD